MALDDRIRTVLAFVADDDADASLQYRQLLDLIGSGEAVADGTVMAAAFLRIDALSRRISQDDRVAILSDPAMRLRSAAAVAHLCGSHTPVAEAALKAARLDDDAWRTLIPALDGPLQDVARRARLGTPEPDDAAHDRPHRDIAALVDRIERFRRRREPVWPAAVAAPANDSGPPARTPDANGAPAMDAFDCRIDAERRITWTSAGSAMLSGLALRTGQDAPACLSPDAHALLLAHRPVIEGSVTIFAAPAISGEWTLSAAPRFDAGGRFEGHDARFERASDSAMSAPETIRRALHELRTPLNAMQGFAELVQQQIAGPVPHQYRAAAAAIAARAADLLAEFEKLERLARLESGAAEIEAGYTAIGPAVTDALTRLARPLDSRGARFEARAIDALALVAVEAGTAEPLVWRVLSAIAARAAEGEVLTVLVAAEGDMATMTSDLPLALVGKDRDALFSEGPTTGLRPSTGMLGGGFALRLATAEARAAGGDLVTDGRSLTLALPLARRRAQSDTGEAA